LALLEIRRVLKNDGYLFLRPLWNNRIRASASYLGVPSDKLLLVDSLKVVGIMAQN
jgi:hypothetical protein